MPASEKGRFPDTGPTTVVSEFRDGPSLDLHVPALTILAHPAVGRVGERVLLPALVSGRSVQLSRLTPHFAQPDSADAIPLGDPHLSRRPITLAQGERSGSIQILASAEATRIDVFGTEDPVELGPADLECGVPLLLGGYVVLLLHLLPAVRPRHLDPHGLVGESSATVALRLAIQRAAALTAPVLLRGETGTGKELVARAIHQASSRRAGPYVALNLGAVPPSLAASELFGAARGSFTGADRRRDGYFARADGGTLFLDEVGEVSPEVQALLLRSLESGEIQPVGADAPSRVDVRVVAATDADLETLISEGRFRTPLLHRLQGDQIFLPPLRERRDDIGRLLIHFLRQELETAGRGHLLDEPTPGHRPWLSPHLVARLAIADWPGNVRQLRNVARRLAAGASAERPADLPPDLGSTLFAVGPKSGMEGKVKVESPQSERQEEGASPRRPLYRPIAKLSEDEILAELRTEHFNLTAAADSLGVSRTALNGWVDHHPTLRKASCLSREEVEAALNETGGSLEEAADLLEVSRHGLRIRRGALGLG